MCDEPQRVKSLIPSMNIDIITNIEVYNAKEIMPLNSNNHQQRGRSEVIQGSTTLNISNTRFFFHI